MTTDPSVTNNDFEVLLEEWGLKQYISNFEDEDYDDPVDWEEFCEDDDGTKLQEERLIVKKGHRKKFVKKWRATFGTKQSNNHQKDVWLVCICFFSIFAFLAFVFIIIIHMRYCEQTQK